MKVPSESALVLLICGGCEYRIANHITEGVGSKGCALFLWTDEIPAANPDSLNPLNLYVRHNRERVSYLPDETPARHGSTGLYASRVQNITNKDNAEKAMALARSEKWY
jgi:hypothetical protein